jgi:riboflavin biosynthesis pyrimidine reductase
MRHRLVATRRCAAQVGYLRASPVDLTAAFARLRCEYGVRSILCEGGPRLNTSLLSAGRLDELFLMVAPKLAGGSPGARTIIGDTPLNEPLDARLVWLLEHDGELFARYRVRAD